MAHATLVKKVVLGAVGAVSLVALHAHAASAASLSFTVMQGTAVYADGNSGSWEGFDNNLDNLLTQNELTSFSFAATSFGHNFNLSGLFGFGSFNLLTGEWNADGAGWGQPTGSYFSWNGGGNAVNSSWATIRVDSYVPSPTTTVPEPASVLGLLVAGALGTTVLKRKQ